MLKARANEINLHYQQHGAGSDAILVHGITSNLSFWLLTVLPMLTERYRVTVYDLRGHGFSDAPPTGYTSGDMAEDLRGLMDYLGIARAHIVGHSFGGVVAMHLAARYPERARSVTLADTAFPALRDAHSIADWPHYAMYQKQLLAYGARLPDNPDPWNLAYFLPELIKLPADRGLRRGLPRQPGRINRLLTQTTLPEDFDAVDDLTRERLRAVQTPTLAAYVEDSPLLPTCRFLTTHLPNCRAEILAGGDHFWPAAAPASFAEPMQRHFAATDAALADMALE